MRELERVGFNAFHIVVAASGLLYLYMKFFMQTDDPFAIVNHPWQPLVLAAHILAAPVFIVFFGMLLRSHTLVKLRRNEKVNRRTGWISLMSFSVMAMSGYLHQVASSPEWINLWWWIHIVTGVLFVIGYGVHFAVGWPIGRARRKRLLSRRNVRGSD